MKFKIFILTILISVLFPFAYAQAKYIKVPYISEVPENIWTPPWSNACEEASITMVEEYYKGNKNKRINKSIAKKRMRDFFSIQNKLYGTNKDADAERTLNLINDYSNFSATIKENPTLEDIKKELNANRPVIIPIYGFGLNNPRIRFRATGSSYHMIVLIGYDDTSKEFVAHDSGDYKMGIDLRYSYDTILNIIHDFDYKRDKADGPARAIFTAQKMLATTKNSHRIYLIKNNKKYYISHPKLFKENKWKWSDIKVVDKKWLANIETGETLKYTEKKDFVTFPTPEFLAKSKNGHAIYLIKNNKKFYISHPRLFKIYNWSWNKIKIVKDSWLKSLKNGEIIRS